MAGVSDDNYNQLAMVEAGDDLDHSSWGTTRTLSLIMENQGRRRHSRNALDTPLVYQPARTPRVPIVAPPSPPPRVRTLKCVCVCFFICMYVLLKLR